MTVFLFFDESGDMNFSASGSAYYFFGALTTRYPSSLTNPLNTLRYDLMGEGLDLQRFHAAEDRQEVRNRVFEAISKVGGFEFDSVVIEKRKANPVLHDEVRFYPQFANYLLKYVFARFTDPAERIVVVSDTIPVKKTRRAIEKAFKTNIDLRFSREGAAVSDFVASSARCAAPSSAAHAG